MAEPDPRRFTAAEANLLLPRLEEALPVLRRVGHRAHDAWDELQRLAAVGTRADGTLIMARDYKLTERRYNRLRAGFTRLLGEVHGLGVQLKDLDMGLVDFPALIDGRKVLLCWRLGEPAVLFYHGYDVGFAGRRPIPPDLP
jgi:hypothetical protein